VAGQPPECAAFFSPKLMTMNFASSPPSTLARYLGYAGLLPFALLAVWLWVMPTNAPLNGLATGQVAAAALVGYGAVIASFLGGVHWGIAGKMSAQDARMHYVWGVVPSLVGWVAIALPAAYALALLVLLLTACYVVDRRSYPRVGWAAWLPMRLQLTAVAVLSCALGAARA
jgi:hypothetical protein